MRANVWELHVCGVENGSRVAPSWTHFLCCKGGAGLAAAQPGTSVPSVDCSEVG